MMALITEHTLWLIPLCLALGAGFGFLLYHKNKNLELEKRTTLLLSCLRGLVVSLICFLLLAPMLKMVLKKVEKPIIVVAIDNSESVVSSKDSAFYKQDYKKNVEKLITSLGDKYDVRPYLIGDENSVLDVSTISESINYDDKTTDLGSIFNDIANFYDGQNVGAMVLLTDGIYNSGENPYYKSSKVKFPVYTVGLGDTESQCDLLISGIEYNKQTFKGNFAPVEIKVLATKLAGKKAKLTVTDENENVVYEKQVAISGNKHFETVRLSIETQESGIHRYEVDLEELEGEITYKNNVANFYLEVIESREKIAIVYNSPHPDVSAIKQALELSDKYEVEVFAADKFKGQPHDFSLIILHQLPSNTHSSSQLIAQIQKEKISALYILGIQSNLSNFNGLHAGLNIVQNKNLMNDASPSYNENFAAFNFSDEAKEMLKNYPPLQTFFGDYKSVVSANVFLYQQIGTVKTETPLLLFNEANGARTGILTGTGLWQWRVNNYMYKQNHDAFNELINKIALYLSVKSDKSQFRIATKNVFDENASVEFSGELYNDSYELINDPDVSMKIASEDGKQYNAIFSKQNNGYYLNMGELPVGDYKWEAVTNNGSKSLRKSGNFSVRELMVETQNLVADHELLGAIAENTDGRFFGVKEMDKIESEIKNNENIKSIASYEKQYSLMLNSWYYFAILMLLFAIEWFLRKWNGGY
ncbi:MAG: VWA domain-containing protein [Bacteroidales bacterium]|nr:VWA domain-containing protein [Bacteroidales bacterium]